MEGSRPATQRKRWKVPCLTILAPGLIHQFKHNITPPISHSPSKLEKLAQASPKYYKVLIAD